MKFKPYKEQEFYRSLLEIRPLILLQTRPQDALAMQERELNRLIEMAWQDRLPFEIIEEQYGLTENQLKKKMRSLISEKSYKRWRRRVQGRATKHTKKLYHKPNRFQGPW
jgi:uncharacterized protein (TIGR03643 family)